MREVYRKLASELHPDREPDPAERIRKTALLQKVNQAYDKGDLLVLLELQLEIEQINPGDLANMARERLVHFNAVLTEQLQRLREELEDIAMPFALSQGGFSSRDVSSQALEQALEVKINDMQQGLRDIDTDLRDFSDIAKLKQWLKHYRVDDGQMDEFALMEDGRNADDVGSCRTHKPAAQAASAI